MASAPEQFPDRLIEMSSVLRHVASLKIPDQNSARKCVHAWLDEFYDGSFHYNWLRFSCADGMYEFIGDTASNSPSYILSEYNSLIYDGVFPCKYTGGLRAVTDFGPNMRNLISEYIGGDADSIRVISPGVASRVQMLDTAQNNYDSYQGFTVNVAFDGGYEGELSASNYVNPLNDMWIVKNPAIFSINDNGTIYEYFYQNPLGDDIYSDSYQPYQDNGSRAVGGAGSRAAPSLAKQQKLAGSLFKAFKPRNAASHAHLVKKAKALIAKAAPAPEAAPAPAPAAAPAPEAPAPAEAAPETA